MHISLVTSFPKILTFCPTCMPFIWIPICGKIPISLILHAFSRMEKLLVPTISSLSQLVSFNSTVQCTDIFPVLIFLFTGRRTCLGDVLTKMEFFLFLSTLIQRFELHVPPKHEMPTVTGTIAASIVPQPFFVSLIHRLQSGC